MLHFLNTKRTWLFQIRKVYFLISTFHSNQPSKHERKIDRKNYLCQRNAIRFMGRRWTIKTPTTLFSINQPCSLEAARLTDQLLSTLWTLNWTNFQKSTCLYNILIFSSSNDDKNRCHEILVLRHLLKSTGMPLLIF